MWDIEHNKATCMYGDWKITIYFETLIITFKN